ncbi:MAG: DUF433 domain-containing protein [Nitrospirota bacterium]
MKLLTFVGNFKAVFCGQLEDKHSVLCFVRRHPTTTATKTLRLRQSLRSEIDRLAKQARRSFSEVTQDLIEEALRMRPCPGIYFANEPAGREAKIAGTGLGAWEIIAALKAVANDERALQARFPRLTEAQLKAALSYYRLYRDEIDTLVAENETPSPEVVQSEISGWVRGA